ncbi:NSFL1 cofactor p47-like isoform X2 [Patiria miniata]|uniref:NSFL1 cofactor p47 n=1 Tax=Patiria miniata TaxID=46514 RepID=A0A913ZMA4_PATMI|nr:NSFL1 cofactor p47-like isoform X2 [Patiria miniata]
MADEAQKASLIADFAGVTGVDADRAKFYLESSGWQLQIALGSFYDNDGGDDDGVMFHEASDDPNTAGRQQPELVDLFGEEPEPEAAPVAARGTGGRTGSATKPPSRFHTVSDFAKDAEADSDSGEEGQTFYAGGSDHGSGQQVVGPRRKKNNTDNMINDLFKSARDHGAQEVGAGSSTSPDASSGSYVFKGAGYRLGDSENTGPVRPEPGTAGTLPAKESGGTHIVLKLWKNGFSVNDGELRDMKAPQNAAFLNDISQGKIPMELIQGSKGGEVNLDLEDHRDEEYVRPKVKVEPFSGHGNMLGSPVPQVISTPSAASAARHDESAAQPTVSVDQSQPVTNIQIRLVDGTRLVNKFNHSHTVADIRRYITAARPAYASQVFALMTTFPNKELTDDTQTLADAKLLNAVIVQQLVK